MESKLGPLPPIVEIEQSLAKFNYKACNYCYFSKAIWRMDPLVAVLCARGILSFTKLVDEVPSRSSAGLLDVSLRTKEKINGILATRFFGYVENVIRYFNGINQSVFSYGVAVYSAGGLVSIGEVSPSGYGRYLARHFGLRNFVNDIDDVA